MEKIINDALLFGNRIALVATIKHLKKGKNVKNWISKVFGIQKGEWALLLLSTGFVFVLFSAYSILRPMRDALGLEGGKDELRWLFLATFIACILASLLLMWLATRVKRRFYTDYVFLFFAFNLTVFYVLMNTLTHESPAFVWLCRAFFVWVSIFNLFAFSSAWSLIADVFNKEKSQRLFGIISAGASLGAVFGAAATKMLVSILGASNLVFVAIALLIVAVILKNLILQRLKQFESEKTLARFDETIGAKNPFAGFSLIFKSQYLMLLAGFVFLLTCVSTFLYMEQARIVREFFPTRDARIAAFANIDLIVQSASLMIQIFLTAKIAKYFGMEWLLGSVGFLIAIGLVFLAMVHPAFWPLVVVMSLRRIGEYAFVKPGREMLFVPLGADEKYKVKNFVDAVVYRAGDAISAQAEALLAQISMVFVLLSGAAISALWGFLGLRLSRLYKKYSDENNSKIPR